MDASHQMGPQRQKSNDHNHIYCQGGPIVLTAGARADRGSSCLDLFVPVSWCGMTSRMREDREVGFLGLVSLGGTVCPL